MAKLSDLAKQVSRGKGEPKRRTVPLPVMKSERAAESAPIDRYGQEKPATGNDWDIENRPTRYTDLLTNHLNPWADGRVTVATITLPRWLGPASASVDYRYDVGFEVVLAQVHYGPSEFSQLINWLADVADRLKRRDSGWFDTIRDQSRRGYLPAGGEISEAVIEEHIAAFLDAAEAVR